MIPSRSQTTVVRPLVHLVFAAALVALVACLVQLAWVPDIQFVSLPAASAGTRVSGSVGGANENARSMRAASADAELADLYALCPMADRIDLETVANRPESIDDILPSHRLTADHVPAPSVDSAMPRVWYPVPLRAPAAAADHDTLRIARVEKDSPPQAPSTVASDDDKASDWLIEPSEWYTPQERARLENGAAAAPIEPVKPPATEPSTDEIPPQVDAAPDTGWRIMTPDDLPATTDDLPPNGGAPVGSSGPAPIVADPVAAPDFDLPGTAPTDNAPPLETVPAAEKITPPVTSEAQTPHFSEPAVAAPTVQAVEPVVPVEPVAPVEPLPSSEAAPQLVTEPVHESPAQLPLPPASPQRKTPDLFAPPAAQESLPLPAAQPAAGPAATDQNGSVDPHLALFAKNNYPSARECATCHADIYHEWSVSAHAYAAVSPMFQKFEQSLNDLSQGTVGYFCVRCHAPVATALNQSRAEPLWNMPEVAREGITCIACHRVQYVYGKSNGERRIEPGDVFAPVFGGIGGEGVAEVIARKDEFKVKTSPDEKGPGQDMHVAGIYFETLTKSEFCTPCHQVQVHPGIKLEVVWEQYRASPACKKGIQCQDCHMGRVPGLPLGYNCGPVAKVAGKTVNDQRRRSNHTFYGPNYSIAHPGIFPFHLKADRWTMEEWLLFDWRAGWGTDEFEDRVADGQLNLSFPPCWSEADDRYDAREIIDENLKKLAHKREIREEVLENGSRVEGPFFDSPLRCGHDIDLHYLITNTNEGHNLLTASLGAQPQLWGNVVLVGPDGRRLWETGYTDSFGDLANIHSHDVRHKKIPFDWQLFNLQTMFLITGAKGTDREFFVPVNVDIDQLPFIRPGTQPISVINHPPFIRMESQSLAPLGSRRVPYRIPGKLVQQPGTYRLSFRMRSRAEPIYFMQFCGATEEMQRAMNEGIVDVHPISVEFTIP